MEMRMRRSRGYVARKNFDRIWGSGWIPIDSVHRRSRRSTTSSRPRASARRPIREADGGRVDERIVNARDAVSLAGSDSRYT